MADTETVVRAYIEAANRDEVERVLDLLHPDVELHEADTLPGSVSAVGLDEVRHYLERFEVHWAKFEWDPLEWRFAGERALLRARLRLEGRRSGIAVDREWTYVFTVRDGKLYRQDGFDDLAAAEQAFHEPC